MVYATKRVDVCDHAINFATTAWHLTDWLWHYHGSHLKKLLGLKDIKEFYILLFDACPYLKTCDVIANAWKHGDLRVKEYRPSVKTIMSFDPEITEDEDIISILDRLDSAKWKVIIEIDGESIPASTHFADVLNFWHGFFHANDIYKREGIIFR